MNFDFLFTSFGTVLAALYDLRHSYAFMIIGLTLIVMVVVTPLTLKATRSMLMMQQLQPEMKRLQSQYKDDRQRLNEELLKFYKENDINPMGSCLPLLVQTPVFLVLYTVLKGLTLRVPVMGSNIGHVVGQHAIGAPLTAPPHVVHTFAPNYVPVDSLLYQHLHGETEMRSIGLDLARAASEVFSTSVIHALPYLVLIALVAITGLVQQRQIQSRNQGTPVNPQQQAIMRVMPFFLPVFSFALPAGLVLYFVVSNTYRVGQQWFISRNIYGKEHAKDGAKDKSGGSEPAAYPGGSGGGGGLQGFLDRLLGREVAPAAEPEPPAGGRSKVSTAKGAGAGKSRPATPAKKAAGGRPAAKAGGRTTGKAAAAKAGSRTDRTDRNGRDRDRDRDSGRDAGREKAGTRTSNAPGSGRAASTKKRASSPEPDASTNRPSTLQPRARKNKKR
jgi:YidC/Oxa1 family membrane protein insertase